MLAIRVPPAAMPAARKRLRDGVVESSDSSRSAATLRAALDPAIPAGGYVGPDGFMELWGDPVPVSASKRATDHDLAGALFDASLLEVGATWPR